MGREAGGRRDELGPAGPASVCLSPSNPWHLQRGVALALALQVLHTFPADPEGRAHLSWVGRVGTASPEGQLGGQLPAAVETLSLRAGVVAHARHADTRGAEAGRSPPVQDQPGPPSGTLSQNTKENKHRRRSQSQTCVCLTWETVGKQFQAPLSEGPGKNIYLAERVVLGPGKLQGPCPCLRTNLPAEPRWQPFPDLPQRDTGMVTWVPHPRGRLSWPSGPLSC